VAQIIRITRSGDVIPTGRASINLNGALRLNVAQGETEDYAFTWDAETSVTSAVVASNFTAARADAGNITTVTVSGVSDEQAGTATLTLTGASDVRVIDLEVGSVVGKVVERYGC